MLSIFVRCMSYSISERCDSNVISTFGHEDSRVQRGWLVNETVVQLKIFGDKALNIWKKKHKGKDFYIKMTAVNANKSTFGEVPSSNDDSQSMDLCATRNKWQSWPIVEVAVSNYTPVMAYLGGILIAEID